MADPVAGLDAAFVITESPTMPWQVLGILVVDPASAPEPFTLDAVRRLVSARLDGIEAFAKMVDGGPLGLMPRWVDGEVDVDWHVRRADLPDNADLADVERLAGELAESPLDRARPLWELHVVERLDDGRGVVIAKVHHALADGVTAVGILAALLDLEPVAAGPPAVDLAPPAPNTGVGLAAVPQLLWRAGWSVGRATVRAAQRGLQAGRHSFAFMAPRTSGHARLTARRQIVTASMAVADIKSAKDRYGVTFNDIVLAAITGAARRWLDADGQLPSRSLLAAVPVSIRSADGQQVPSRNQVSAMFVSLPVHIDDPVERVRLIGQDTRRSKVLHEQAGATTLGDLAAIAPWHLLGGLWNASWWSGAATIPPPVANLVVSSVPGPPIPLYLAGARLVGLHPIGPLFEGVPLNITAVSREDRVDVGIVSCPDIQPDIAPLADWLPEALTELLDAAPPPGPK